MSTEKAPYRLFDRSTRAIIYGLQANAIQRMLDFDHACGRQTPSVAAIVNENKAGWQKVFWYDKELLLPMYRSISRACSHHPDADLLINFASFRSAYPTTCAALAESSLRTVVVIAEGMPERYARSIRQLAQKLGKTVIGPATVGGIAAGAFKVGNTGGTIDNIIASKLHRAGHVGFVSKSGGMSNEAYNIIARNTDGLYEGIAIGGDSFPGSTLIEHVLRYEDNPDIAMIVALGELGGESEYDLVHALQRGEISKPVVCWVTGTCARIFPSSIQFGHAGARADAARETAAAKNEALRAAGALVPESFDDFDRLIRDTFQDLVANGKVRVVEDFVPRPTPLGFNEAVAQHVVRRKTSFTTTISDDRGDEPLYAGLPLSTLVGEPHAIGETVGLLWFKRRLPEYARRFIELTLVLVADHGPAVSGAHNTIVAARAGKDLVSSLVSGLLTIGPRFGGAISGAAAMFKEGVDQGLTPEGFVRRWKERGINIQGIGHKVKSIHNPDTRVSHLIAFARQNFPSTRHLDYALAVEASTTKKRDNLILNVDGCIGVLFLDIMDGLGFTPKEIDDIVLNGGLDGLFVLGRSIGLIGHFFDQKRLLEPLYRHPTDDILYALPRPDELE